LLACSDTSQGIVRRTARVVEQQAGDEVDWR
jgi:hypothetical protein